MVGNSTRPHRIASTRRNCGPTGQPGQPPQDEYEGGAHGLLVVLRPLQSRTYLAIRYAPQAISNNMRSKQFFCS